MVSAAVRAHSSRHGKRLVSAALLTGLLTGCAAQPTQPPVAAAPAAPAPAPAAPTAATVPDFTQITQTSCPGQTASYQEWVARFGAYALHQGEPRALEDRHHRPGARLEKVEALATALGGEVGVAADDQALAGEVGRGDGGHVALVEQGEL